MRCPKCGSTNCQVFVTNNVKIHSSTKGLSAGKACCGTLLLGPIGLLCGACGAGKSNTWSEEEQQEYWICQNCGSKFTQSDAKYASVPVRFYLDNVNDFADYEGVPVVQKFVKNYSENWRTSVLGENMIVRQSSDKKFLKHKDSCEEKWFEEAPILFAIEDCTGIIVTGKDIIIDTVRLALGEISCVAIYDATIYIGTYCIRFSSADKAKKFIEMIRILLDANQVKVKECTCYEELLAYLQNMQDEGNASQETHFSSQPEYEGFVKGLTKKGLEKLRQERPQHYRNYVKTEEDEKMLRQPATIAYIIQMVLIFFIRFLGVGFWNAIFNTLVWGVILGIAWLFYDSEMETRFEKEKEKYLPPELFALIKENRLTRIQKTGSIKIADLNQYEQLQGLERLQQINERESIEQKRTYLLVVLVVTVICITVFHLFLAYSK